MDRQAIVAACCCQYLDYNANCSSGMNIFIALTSLILFIYCYFILATFFAHRKFNYLQETSIAIVVGLIVGVNVFSFTDFFHNGDQGNQEQIRDIIFLLLLPPIMFEDGYNFPKRKFVQNIFYVNLYGLLGTILSFLVVWGGLTLFNNMHLFVSISNSSEYIVLANWQILLMSAAFCSVEPIVTEKVVDKARYPKLFSIMLGESLYKDTIAITLFDTIREMVIDSNDPSFDIEGSDVGLLILRFLEVVAGSIFFGFVAGIITTLIFKNLRFLVKEQGITQMALTILSGYLAYISSQALQFSGVISMLFCGTILSHYNIYNLTEVGSSSTKVAIDVLKMTASGIIFFFIGFEMFNIQSFESQIDQTQKETLSLALLGLTFVVLLVGRVVNIYFTSLLGYLLTGKEKWKLNVYEYFIIFLMGLIHGAVPFALSVTLPFITLPSTNCTQLNIIFVVVISSIIFNIFVPKLIRLMLANIRQLEINDRNHPSVKDSFLENRENLRFESKLTMVDDPSAPFFKKLKTNTEKYWKKLENGFIKPHLIFNYHERKDQIKLDKLNKRKEEHEKYLKKFMINNKENILNADNEELNQFYEVVYSDQNSDSDQEEEGRIVIRTSKDADTLAKDKQRPSDARQKETEIPTMPIRPAQNKTAKSQVLREQAEGGKEQRRGSEGPLPSAQPAPQLQKQESRGEMVITIEQK